MMGTALPPITVVISTRDRGHRVVKTVQSILANDYPHFELRIIDQSQDGLTETALRPFLNNPRVCYVKTLSKGLSAGRNLGISGAGSEIIAATDDDCEAPPNWLRELAGVFAKDDRIGVVFGNTMPGPHDPALGFIPAYVRDEPFLALSIYHKNRVEGVGACMGLRRSVWQALAGFDEMLGAGAPFQSGEEIDFAIRALLEGYGIFETPSVSVVHHGFHTWDCAAVVLNHYWRGTGAVFAKHLKFRNLSVVILLMGLAWRWIVGNSPVAASFGSRGHKLLRLAAFARGFAEGVITPVDRITGHYRPRKRP